MNYFTLDGHSTTEWGIGLSAGGAYDAPARKGESISVPGRSGNIWVDDGSYENVMLTYPCWMSEGFDSNIDDFRTYLSKHSDQYYKLSDTYHPNEFRLGRYAGPFSTTPGTRNLSGRFDVVFDCQPQRFLNSGAEWKNLEIPNINPEQAVANLFTETNPTGFRTYAMLCVAGTGEETLNFSFRNTDLDIWNVVSLYDYSAGKYYYIDLLNFIVYESTVADSADISGLARLDSWLRCANAHGRNGEFENDLALFEGENIINNSTLWHSGHNTLTHFSIMTRYWTI